MPSVCSALALLVVVTGARAISPLFRSLDARKQESAAVAARCNEPAQQRLFNEGDYFWASKNGDAQSSGVSNYMANVEVTHGPAWTFKDRTASIVSVHPCIDAERNIYLSTRNGVVRKFNPTGKVLWENKDNFLRDPRDEAQNVVGGPVLADGAIFVGSTDGHILALNMSTGSKLWRKQATPRTGGDAWSLAAHNGVVISVGRSDQDADPVPDFGGNQVIAALSTATGDKVWQLRSKNILYNFLGSFVDGPPSLVFSDFIGQPFRVRLCDGEIIWQNDHGIPESSSVQSTTGGAVVGPNGLLFVTHNFDDHGQISAYNLTNGKQVWTQTVQQPVMNAPAVGSLRRGGPLAVVVGAGENPGMPDPAAEARGYFEDGRKVQWTSELLAIDAATGKYMDWRWAPPPHERPQAEGDHLPNHLCLPDAWSNAAIDGEGTVYVGHMSGNLFQVRDLNGDGRISEESGEVQRFYGGRCYQGSPGLAPGLLVGTPCDGMHVWTV